MFNAYHNPNKLPTFKRLAMPASAAVAPVLIDNAVVDGCIVDAADICMTGNGRVDNAERVCKRKAGCLTTKALATAQNATITIRNFVMALITINETD